MISAGLARVPCDIMIRPFLCGFGVLRHRTARSPRGPVAELLQAASPDARGPTSVSRLGLLSPVATVAEEVTLAWP